MDEERFEHVAAEVFALRIMISAFTELHPDPILLHQAISRHAEHFVSILPTTTEEQRQYAELVRRKLNTFSHLM